MNTYGKYQDNKCSCCGHNVATTIRDDMPMCLVCATADYHRQHRQGNLIYVSEEMSPRKLQCVYCGSTDEERLVEHRGVHLCHMCLAELKAKGL